ncbi:unnamed protein product [Closterium sp. NIES-64]|nr:unnamed protein product [Closterium sp. NIES-64]
MRFSAHRGCCTLFAALAVAACLLATGVPSAEAYDPLDPTGNITIVWDVTSWAGDGYIAWVKMYNYQHYRKIDPPGWALTWNWTHGEYIWDLTGAVATKQGDCSKLQFPGGKIPHSCMQYPVVMDLMPADPLKPDAPGVLKNCCKAGYLGANKTDPGHSLAAFMINVGNATSTVWNFVPPGNFSLGVDGYKCTDPFQVNSTIYTDPTTRRETQAQVTYHIVCTYSSIQKRDPPKCCVSLSSFYNDTIIPCASCACACGNYSASSIVCVPTGGKVPYLMSTPSGDGLELKTDQTAMECSPDGCPISIHYHFKQNYEGFWRAKITIINRSLWDNHTNWNVVVEHPNMGNLTDVFSWKAENILPYGVNNTAIFFGMKQYNDVLMPAGKGGNVQSEMLFAKTSEFTLEDGWVFPRPLPEQEEQQDRRSDRHSFYGLLLTLLALGIATVLCMGVVNPMASGIGGGAFILIRAPNGSAEFIDCRETAPAAAHQDMFEGHEEDIRKGGLSVGVPGEIAGLYLAWQRHGRLTWRDLVTPAADMAESGFHVAAYLANSIAASNATILSDPGLSAVFAPGGKLLRKGDTCYRPALAATLKAIAETGPDALHRGERARALVKEIQAMGGILTEKDLEDYQAQVREVLVGKAFGLDFLMAPPPSSGGVVILQVLKILQGYELPLASAGVLGLHRVVESLKHAFALRMHLGDPAFVNVTDVIQDMLSDEFAARLRSAIHDNITFPPEHYGHPEDESEEDKKRHPHRHQLYAQLDDHGTSHTCVVDQDRMAVSITSTVNGPWGAGRMAVQSGIVLNNEMADFSLPYRPGRIPMPFEPPPAPANFIRAGKRPLSSMAPAIVLQDGQLKAVVGGAGGTVIISAVLQVILHFFCQGYSPFKAIDAPRIHHQLLPNTLFYEAGHALDDGERISAPNATLAAPSHSLPVFHMPLLPPYHQLLPNTLFYEAGHALDDGERISSQWSIRPIPHTPPFSPQLLPNTVFYEAGHALDDGERISVPNATLAALTRRNHTTFPIQFGGFVQFIVQDLDGPAVSVALQKLDGPPSAEQRLDSAAAVPSHGPGRKLISDQKAAKLAMAEPNFPPPLFGQLTAVSDPRKDGGPAGY